MEKDKVTVEVLSVSPHRNEYGWTTSHISAVPLSGQKEDE